MYYSIVGAVCCLSAMTIFVVLGFANASTVTYPDVEIGPNFDVNGKLLRPSGFRRWVFVGSPVTPNSLNGGAAAFPEFHNVYVEPAVYEYYLENGAWPQGTVIVKELQLAIDGDRSDGSRMEASGRGYFPGSMYGLDVSVKDAGRFPDTNGWGFFNFGHHAPPYADSAAEAAVAACAGCHIASAHDDMVFSDFYRQLRSQSDGSTMPNEH